jgi:hypothetical protein
VDILPKLRACFEEPAKAFAHFREPPSDFPLKNSYRTQGEQANHGTTLQALRPSVRQAEHVVKEPVFFVPYSRISTGMDHGRSDPQKMLNELLGDHLKIIGDDVLSPTPKESKKGSKKKSPMPS